MEHPRSQIDTTRGATGRPILVVDDDRRIREIIQWALEEEGFVVETAADGEQALERAAHHQPALVVLDLVLPFRGGEAVSDWLRATYGEDCPILVITADRQAAEKARRIRAFAYLTKPFDVDDLAATVRRGLER
jgi:DNA-binding response OmpR family regulator